MSGYHGTTVAALQAAFLNSLGIYQRGYAPEGAVGRGRVVFADEDLQARLAWAGYQGPVIRTWFTGKVAMTTRTMMGVAQAAYGSEVNREPLVAMQVRAKPVWTG